jgi:hypothetical protein
VWVRAEVRTDVFPRRRSPWRYLTDQGCVAGNDARLVWSDRVRVDNSFAGGQSEPRRPRTRVLVASGAILRPGSGLQRGASIWTVMRAVLVQSRPEAFA